jgi:AcrR family transcriptional regulator
MLRGSPPSAEAPTRGIRRQRAAPSTPRGQETHRRLLDAALKVFLAHGYVGARVEEIVQTAGVAYGTFYHYFGTKSGVIRALADHVYGEIFGESTRELLASGPLVHRAFEQTVLNLKAFTRRRDALRVLDDAVGADPSIAAEVFRLQQRDVDAFAEILRSNGEVHLVAEPEIISLLINSLHDEVARRWIRSERCTGDPDLDEPEISRIARVLAIMGLSITDPQSLGISRAHLRDLMERMCTDGDR